MKLMFPFLASALLSLQRNLPGEDVEPPEVDKPQRFSPLALVPPASITVPMMAGDPSPLSRTLEAMLKVLEEYVKPPLMAPPPPPLLPPASVLLASVVERTVGLGSRVGTDMRGPFSVAALKGLRVEAVVRYEIWAHTAAEIGPAIEDLIKHLLGDRDLLRVAGFLRVALKATGASENVFAEDAWRQSVEFDVLFEFPYVDSDGAESLIARIPIKMVGEFNESSTVVDEMTRWDNELAPSLELRGPLSIGALTALAFIHGNVPTGKVTVTRTFDGAIGAPTSHPTLNSFVAAVGGDNPAERHAEVTFPSLAEFLKALASFKITDTALGGMRTDPVPVPGPIVVQLEALKDEEEVGGEDEFVALLEATIGVADTGTFKPTILKHAATSTPMTMGDWDKNDIPDEYQSLQFRIKTPIRLAGVTDRFEIAYVDPSLDPVRFDKVAVVYLRATRGLTT
jgi:hypothetical protein